MLIQICLEIIENTNIVDHYLTEGIDMAKLTYVKTVQMFLRAFTSSSALEMRVDGRSESE